MSKKYYIREIDGSGFKFYFNMYLFINLEEFESICFYFYLMLLKTELKDFADLFYSFTAMAKVLVKFKINFSSFSRRILKTLFLVKITKRVF